MNSSKEKMHRQKDTKDKMAFMSNLRKTLEDKNQYVLKLTNLFIFNENHYVLIHVYN